MAGLIRRSAFAAVVSSVLVLAMEGWARAATFTVSNTNDSGGGSLRDAITSANSAPTVTNTINFSVSGTITLGSSLPAIANTSPGSLMIDGGGQAVTVDGANTFQIFIVNSGATLNLRSLTLTRGTVEGVSGLGGAIFNGGTLTISESTLSANRAIGANTSVGLAHNGVGGAIYNQGVTTITDSTFSGNQAIGGHSGSEENGQGLGGAIFDNDPGTLVITNCTFSANQVIGGGGGIGGQGGAIFDLGTFVSVTNSTFSNNAAIVGGAIFNNSGVMDVKGAILAGSTGGNCFGTNTPAVTDEGYNISDDGTCGFSGTSINNSTTLNLDPAGLAKNGGPTETIALEPHSQAVDFIPKADCTDQSSPTPLPLTEDQRGFHRPDSGNPNFCDAGAFELTTMPFALDSERMQIARSMTPNSDQLNLALTFTEFGSPTCDSGDDAFNGIGGELFEGTCASIPSTLPILSLGPFVTHTINGVEYGTFFETIGLEVISARIVALPTPDGACGEWRLNMELSGLDTTALGLGGGNPFGLILFNPDGDQQCFDIDDAIVGTQITPPTHGVRRGARHGRR